MPPALKERIELLPELFKLPVALFSPPQSINLVFRFITRQHFLVNLLAALALIAALLFGVLWALDSITYHGEFEKVPTVTGKSLQAATELLESKDFNVEVQDSVWDESMPPLTVIKQLPLGEQMVKSKRTIYLSINRAAPPVIEIPNFVGLSFRNAELYLKQLGLKLGDTLRKPDIAKDAVLEQLYNGLEIKPGTKIFQGSIITLVLGNGLGEEEMEVPLLIGMTFGEARTLLRDFGLNVGAIIVDPDVKDSVNAFIYKQNPDLKQLQQDGSFRKNKIRPGQSIDLWMGSTKIEVTPEPNDSTGKQPANDGTENN